MTRIGELLFALKQLDAQVIRDRLTPESNDEKECSVDSQESDGSDGVGDVGVDVKHLSVTPPGWDAPLLKGGSTCTSNSTGFIVVVLINGFSFSAHSFSSIFLPLSDTSSTCSFLLYLPSPPACNHICASEDVSFKLRAGQNILIVGENGSGKSSLLRVISGLWEAQEGTWTRSHYMDNLNCVGLSN